MQVLQVRSDRPQKFQPYGLKGGGAGRHRRAIISRSADDDKQALPGKFMRSLKRGEYWPGAELAGGGGWGNPLDRTTEKGGKKDVIDEKFRAKSGFGGLPWRRR